MIEGIGVDDQAVEQTRDAMAAGDEIIVQGAFRLNGWIGRTDVLRRVETASDLGKWSYEVIDTKLARETKGGTVLQLCLYADLVTSVQGTRPIFSYVVAPWSDFVPQIYRMDDYLAYYRRVRSGLKAAIGEHAASEIYPDPKEHCDTCRWQDRCDKRRRADDHLSLGRQRDLKGWTFPSVETIGPYQVDDLRDLPLIERKRRLAKLIGRAKRRHPVRRTSDE